VSRARLARRAAVTAAYGAGGLGLLLSAATGLLIAQAKLARRTVGKRWPPAPDSQGVYLSRGAQDETEPIELLMIGDSTAAGLGALGPTEKPATLRASRPVRVTSVAFTGAQTADLADQINRALATVPAPAVAVLLIGANDVTHRVRPSVSVRQLVEAVHRLRAVRCEVVVATCPDLGTVEPIAQPLRYLARRSSRRLAAAQTIGVVEAGGRTVSFGDILGPEFAARPREMFGPDRFHPSATGYASAAMVLLPSVCAALGYWPADETEPDYRRGEGVFPVGLAAVEAVESAGTEVAGASVAGRERGPRGRWALLRRRDPIPTRQPG
jgi:lysophospholipase L1-like esterase